MEKIIPRVLVVGSSNFIGSYLVKYLKNYNHFVRGADLRFPEYTLLETDEFYKLDLTNFENCLEITAGIDWLFNLTSEISESKDTDLITANLITAAKSNNITKHLISNPSPAQLGFNGHSVFFYHVYGPKCDLNDKTNLITSLCKTIVLAKESEKINFTGNRINPIFVEDCVHSLYTNLNSDEIFKLINPNTWITAAQLVNALCLIANKKVLDSYLPIESIPSLKGLDQTYNWIKTKLEDKWELKPDVD